MKLAICDMNKTPLTFYEHSCSDTADNFWFADNFGSANHLIYMYFFNNATLHGVNAYITADTLFTKCQGASG